MSTYSPIAAPPPTSTAQSNGLHILWANEAADFIGGCEQYIHNTVRLLQERGVRNTLLYDCNHPGFSTDFVAPFGGAFPMVDLNLQLPQIAPDVVYIHRISSRAVITNLSQCGVPAVRFFHDYQIFCPREHRYSVIGLKTCKKPMGARCYFPCLGVINRSDRWPRLRLNRVGKLRAAIRANLNLDAYIVGSEYMAELIEMHGFERSRIHVIPLYAPSARERTHV